MCEPSPSQNTALAPVAELDRKKIQVELQTPKASPSDSNSRAPLAGLWSNTRSGHSLRASAARAATQQKRKRARHVLMRFVSEVQVNTRSLPCDPTKTRARCRRIAKGCDMCLPWRKRIQSADRRQIHGQRREEASANAPLTTRETIAWCQSCNFSLSLYCIKTENWLTHAFRQLRDGKFN